MAMVSIDIDAMQALVQTLQNAERDGPDAADQLASVLRQEWLSVPQLNAWVSGGSVWAGLHTLLGDCRQRLGLAQMIRSSGTSWAPTVVCDDQYASKFPTDFQWQPPDQAVQDALTQKLVGAGGGLTEGEARELATRIAIMIANADEPYRSLYTQHVDQLVFSDLAKGQGAYYSSKDDTIYIDVDTLMDDQPVPFHTFFHEFGHAIDDAESNFGFETTWFTYTVADGASGHIANFLTSDARTQLTAAAEKFTTDPDQAQWVVSTIIYPSTNSPENLDGWTDQFRANYQGPLDSIPPGSAAPGSDADLYVQLRNYYTKPGTGVFANSDSRTASDIYGPQTNFAIQGMYGHREWSYWYGPNIGSPAAKEFWAGYAADNMTYYAELAERAAPSLVPGGDQTTWSSLGETGRDVTQAAFPDATEAANAMAGKMATS